MGTKTVIGQVGEVLYDNGSVKVEYGTDGFVYVSDTEREEYIGGVHIKIVAGMIKDYLKGQTE